MWNFFFCLKEFKIIFLEHFRILKRVFETLLYLLNHVKMDLLSRLVGFLMVVSLTRRARGEDGESAAARELPFSRYWLHWCHGARVRTGNTGDDELLMIYVVIVPPLVSDSSCY